MTEAAKEARRAYQKEWRKKNPDKVKKIQIRYWQRVAERAQKGEKAIENSNS